MSIFTVRTPRSVALASALLISGLIAVVYVVLLYSFGREFDFFWLILLLPSSFLIAFGIVYFLVEKFLYHKVKIIFKTIHSLKV